VMSLTSSHSLVLPTQRKASAMGVRITV